MKVEKIYIDVRASIDDYPKGLSYLRKDIGEKSVFLRKLVRKALGEFGYSILEVEEVLKKSSHKRPNACYKITTMCIIALGAIYIPTSKVQVMALHDYRYMTHMYKRAITKQIACAALRRNHSAFSHILRKEEYIIGYIPDIKESIHRFIQTPSFKQIQEYFKGEVHIPEYLKLETSEDSATLKSSDILS